MSLGQRLYDLRKTTGLSQEKAAEQLGVTRQTVSKWETDQTTPDFDKIIPICNLYNVTTAELFGEEKENDYSYNIIQIQSKPPAIPLARLKSLKSGINIKSDLPCF